MHRPQFFQSTPQGFTDVPFVQPVPSVGMLAAGQYLRNIPVNLDADADQIFHSLYIPGADQASLVNLQIQIRDAWGNYRTDGFVPLWLYATGAGSTPPDGGSGRTKVFEPELFCPKGSALLLDFYNPG